MGRAALLVSELLANAVVHGGRHRDSPPRMVWCHIQRAAGTVWLGAWGPPCTTVPSPGRSLEDATAGAGLCRSPAAGC